MGRLLRARSPTSREKTGLSASDSRTTRPMATNTMLNRNGSRHPHASNCAGEVNVVTARNSSCARISPAGTPTCENEPYAPRLAGGACSTAISAAPPHSPPADTPWSNRSTTSRTGAATPIWSYVGSRPTPTVAAPITRSDATSIALRPTRSPKWPHSTPPNGRARIPTPSVAKPASVPDAGESVTKNCVVNTSGTAVEKMKKSYHSIVVPIALATATRRSCVTSTPTVVAIGSPCHSGRRETTSRHEARQSGLALRSADPLSATRSPRRRTGPVGAALKDVSDRCARTTPTARRNDRVRDGCLRNTASAFSPPRC